MVHWDIEKLRTTEMTDLKDDPDTENLLFGINEEKTNELAAMPKYQIFRKWCNENGVYNPSVNYPVAFGKHGHLVGMGAARDIPPMTAFLYVPWKLMINEHNIRKRNPEMGALYDKHPEIFKKHHDAEYLRLIIFIWHERCKGEDSFWKPFIDLINFTDLPFLWTDDELAEF